MITNNVFDGVTHRKMRSLFTVFRQSSNIGLHGSAKKLGSLDGGRDENVFDIQQGVQYIGICKRTSKFSQSNILIFGNGQVSCSVEQ